MKKSKLKKENKALKELAIEALKSDDVCVQWKEKISKVFYKKKLNKLVKEAFNKGYIFDNFKCLEGKTIFMEDIGNAYEFEIREEDQLWTISTICSSSNCLYKNGMWAEKFCCSTSKERYAADAEPASINTFGAFTDSLAGMKWLITPPVLVTRCKDIG